MLTSGSPYEHDTLPGQAGKPLAPARAGDGIVATAAAATTPATSATSPRRTTRLLLIEKRCIATLLLDRGVAVDSNMTASWWVLVNCMEEACDDTNRASFAEPTLHLLAR